MTKYRRGGGKVGGDHAAQGLQPISPDADKEQSATRRNKRLQRAER